MFCLRLYSSFKIFNYKVENRENKEVLEYMLKHA